MEPEPEPEPLFMKSGALEPATEDLDVLSLDLTCSICLDAFNAPVRTPCGHLFCRPCITEYIRTVASAGNSATCPHDREPLAASDLVPDHETARLASKAKALVEPDGGVASGGALGGDVVAYCSWCGFNGAHGLVGTNVIRRNVYRCSSCLGRSLFCKQCNVRMAKGGLWDEERCGPCLTGAREDSMVTSESVTGPPGVIGTMLAQAMDIALKGVGPDSVAGLPRLDGAVALARTQEQKVELELSNASTFGRDVRRHAAERLVASQTATAAGGGFLSGIGGLLTLAVTLPANVVGVTVLQIRLVCAIAHLAGWDVTNDRVAMMCYTCLAGEAAAPLLAKCGVQVGRAITQPALAQLAQRLAVQLSGRASSAGVAKAVPLLGGAVGAALDAKSTYAVGQAALSVFWPDGRPS